MFELPVTFGAFADHAGHPGSGFFFACGAHCHFTDLALGTGQVLQPPVDQQQAFRYGLFRRGQKALVEPHGVCPCHLIEAAGHVLYIESAAEHLGSKQSHALADQAVAKTSSTWLPS